LTEVKVSTDMCVCCVMLCPWAGVCEEEKLRHQVPGGVLKALELLHFVSCMYHDQGLPSNFTALILDVQIWARKYMVLTYIFAQFPT
jgi:hypothetical protein